MCREPLRILGAFFIPIFLMTSTPSSIGECFAGTNQNIAAYLHFPCATHDGFTQTQFRIHDGPTQDTKPSAEHVLGHEPYRFLACLGAVPALLRKAPHPDLIDYLSTIQTACRSIIELPEAYGEHINDHIPPNQKLMTVFPHEAFAEHRHLVPRAAHYELLDKRTLPKIGIPVPAQDAVSITAEHVGTPEALLQKISSYSYKLPCVLKLTQGLAGETTWILKDPKDAVKAAEDLHLYVQNEAVDTLILQEFIDAEENVGIQFFIHEDGTYTSFGLVEQLMTADDNYEGGALNVETALDVPAELEEVMRMTSAYASAKGYQGWVAMDALKNGKKWYVIDGNFRMSGNAPLALLKNEIEGFGHQAAQLTTAAHFAGSIPELLASTHKQLADRSLILLSAVEKSDQQTSCFSIVSGKTHQAIAEQKEALASLGLVCTSSSH